MLTHHFERWAIGTNIDVRFLPWQPEASSRRFFELYTGLVVKWSNVKMQQRHGKGANLRKSLTLRVTSLFGVFTNLNSNSGKTP